MRIGIITDAIDDGAAGIGTYVRNLVEKLIKLDKKNEYYLIHGKKSEDKFYKQFRGNKRVYEVIIPIKKILFGREVRKIVYMPKILERYNLDVVHETAQTGPFFRKSKFKKIVTIHDLVPLIYPRAHSYLVHMHHKFGLPVMLRNVDKIIAVSKNTKKDIEKIFKIPSSKIKIIYEAPNIEFSSPTSQSKIINIKDRYGLKDYFFVVGSIEPRKNLERIIKAFNELYKTKNIQLVIATKKGWKNKKILRLVKRSKGVIVVYNISNEELRALYSGAKATIFVSLYEGFGLPILESMACGCPVITSNVSSMPEVANNAAILVNPLKDEKIVDAMENILDKRIAKKLIIAGFKNIKRFSWKKAAKETLKVYKEVLK